MYACTGLLFNHESPLRPERFVSKKIIAAAVRIAQGSKEKLTLGNLEIIRDWGWAPDYVEAMWLMLQRKQPEDFVIATGESHSLEEFVQHAFQSLGLDWRDHVVSSPELLRPTDLSVGRANPQKANSMLQWRASLGMKQVVEQMLNAERTGRDDMSYTKAKTGNK
jgi:GDPmannose 4,6-dehydratase